MNNIRAELISILGARLEAESTISSAVRSVTRMDAIELKIEGVEENESIKNVMKARLDAIEIASDCLVKLSELDEKELELVKRMGEYEKKKIDIAKFMNGEEVEV